MSKEYDNYLEQHRANVMKGFKWLKEELPVLFSEDFDLTDHDISKNESFQYRAYDAYFYGNNKSNKVVEDFNLAWLDHIHKEPHHWQHWVLINDDPNEGTVCLEMPERYVIEMICDWWAFSWSKGNLYEIFKWYNEHEVHIKLHKKTRARVEYVLDMIGKKLEKKVWKNDQD